jgi:hypothetical protein
MVWGAYQKRYQRVESSEKKSGSYNVTW